MLNKLTGYLEEIKGTLKLWQRLQILDPRNIQNTEDVCIAYTCRFFFPCLNLSQASWEHYEDLFGEPKPQDTTDELESMWRERREVLKLEWERYLKVHNEAELCSAILFLHR